MILGIFKGLIISLTTFAIQIKISLEKEKNVGFFKFFLELANSIKEMKFAN